MEKRLGHRLELWPGSENQEMAFSFKYSAFLSFFKISKLFMVEFLGIDICSLLVNMKLLLPSYFDPLTALCIDYSDLN